MMAIKDKIRPIYQALQGFLAQTPRTRADINEIIRDEAIWGQLNQAIDKLNEVSGKNYDQFKITPQKRENVAGYSVSVVAYRQQLGGLVDWLHAEYFSEEAMPSPIRTTPVPSTIVTQTQSQEQSTQVVILLEIQEKILNKLQDDQISPQERGFLERVKDELGGVKNVVGLLNLILVTAKEMGISLDILADLFK